jgi:hypothetical protein
MTHAHSVNLEKLQKGALILGTDLEIGVLEDVEPAQGSQQARLLVRHGHADYLLGIPVDAILDAEPSRIHLAMRREDAERLVYESDGDAGPTHASPDIDKVLGAPEPELPQGPSTG